MEWLKNLSKAIAYIEHNLDKEISIQEAARIACCSPSYFQRIFSYVAGVSLSEYIRQRRMSQAAFELQTTNKKILDIALKYGYSSPTAFNRAFQKIHGISPVFAKNQGSVLNAYPPLQFSIQITGGHKIPYRIEKKEAMRFVGFSFALTEDREENQKTVSSFWGKIFQNGQFSILCHLSNQAPHGILGITSQKEKTYFIGVATDCSAPEQMIVHQIPQATWVIFESRLLCKKSTQDIFNQFLLEWLPFSGYEDAKLPCIEMDHYHSQNCPSEVWIAIKKKKEEPYDSNFC